MPAYSYRYFLPGDRFLIVFLAFLSAFPPLTTDMYLPALPAMGANLGADDALTSYSISGFLFIFALSMIIWGPLSDKFGRKPVLLGGTIVFIISSAAIALCNSIYSLLFWRCIEACGSGAACAMALAIVKDIFRGKSMEKVISLLQTSTILAPMLAPVIGGGLLMFTSWRGVFWTLTCLGLVALLGSFALKETAPRSASISVLATFCRIGSVMTNKTFLYPLLLFSSMAMPFMSYLAVSSFIYQDGFGISPQAFSLFFAFNATVSLAGPFLHLCVFMHKDRRKIISLHLALITIFGCLLLLFGNLGPWFFALLFMPVTICGSAIRPPATVLMLNCLKGDTGIVTSLINCGGLLFGSLSMLIATLAFWPTPIIAIGSISACISGICLIAWFYLAKKY